MKIVNVHEILMCWDCGPRKHPKSVLRGRETTFLDFEEALL